LLPDTPSGVSIFFCPETKSARAYDNEKDRLLALADKVNLSVIGKLVKQKLYIPNTIMDIPSFFAKVLYAIDHSLQKHWHSFSNSDDRLFVNNNVLRMHEVQESILSLSFSRKIPKSIGIKIDNHLEKRADKKTNLYEIFCTRPL